MNHNLSSSVIELIDQSEYEDRKILAASVAVSGSVLKKFFKGKGKRSPPPTPPPTRSLPSLPSTPSSTPTPKKNYSPILSRNKQMDLQQQYMKSNNSFSHTSKELLKGLALVPGKEPTILTDLETYDLIFGNASREQLGDLGEEKLASSILKRYAQRWEVKTATKTATEHCQSSLQKTYECLKPANPQCSGYEHCFLSSYEYKEENKEFLFAIELLRVISQVVGPLSEALLTPLSVLGELDRNLKIIEKKTSEVTGEAEKALLEHLKEMLVGQAENLVDLLEKLNDPKERGIYWAIFANPSEITLCEGTMNMFLLYKKKINTALNELGSFGGYEDAISSQEKYLRSMSRFFQMLATIESGRTIESNEDRIIEDLPEMLQLCHAMIDDLMIRTGGYKNTLEGIKIAKSYLECFAGGEGADYLPYTRYTTLDLTQECEHSLGMTLTKCKYGTDTQKHKFGRRWVAK